MGLRMKNFNIIGVHWKIWFLREGHEKPICLKRVLGQFANLRKVLAKKRVWVFLRGVWYLNAHYDDKSFLSIFPKIPSEIICSKICWQNSAKACFMCQQWTATVLIFLKGSNCRLSGLLFRIYFKNSYFDTSISNNL